MMTDLQRMRGASEQVYQKVRECMAETDLTLALVPRGLDMDHGYRAWHYLPEVRAEDRIAAYRAVTKIITRYDIIVDVWTCGNKFIEAAIYDQPSKRYLMHVECVLTSTGQDTIEVSVLQAWAKKQRMPEVAAADSEAQRAVFRCFREFMLGATRKGGFASQEHIAEMEADLDCRQRESWICRAGYTVGIHWSKKSKDGNGRRWRKRNNMHTERVKGSMMSPGEASMWRAASDY